MITLQCLLEFKNEKDKEVVLDLMRRFSSAMRYAYGRYKNWQVLFTAFAFCCLEKSYRDFSPLKQLIVSRDWARMVSRLVPVLGAGSMTLPKYRLLGLEVRAWQTCLKWRNTNTPTQTVQSNSVLQAFL